jgi:hypothetical protein
MREPRGRERAQGKGESPGEGREPRGRERDRVSFSLPLPEPSPTASASLCTNEMGCGKKGMMRLNASTLNTSRDAQRSIPLELRRPRPLAAEELSCLDLLLTEHVSILYSSLLNDDDQPNTASTHAPAMPMGLTRGDVTELTTILCDYLSSFSPGFTASANAYSFLLKIDPLIITRMKTRLAFPSRRLAPLGTVIRGHLIKMEDQAISAHEQFDRDMMEGLTASCNDSCRNPNCGKKTVTHYSYDTRAADEPSTLFYVCLSCGAKWRG